MYIGIVVVVFFGFVEGFVSGFQVYLFFFVLEIFFDNFNGVIE